MRSRWEWLVPLTGALFVVLVVVGAVIAGEPPEAKDNVQDIINHYVDNKDSVEIGSALLAIGGAALVFFFGYLRTILRAAEGEGGMLSLVALAGAAILATGIAIDATIYFALAEAVDDIQPAAVQALQALWDNDFFPIALGSTVMLLATGISVVRHAALPKWLGWVAIVLGIVGLTPAGFFAFLGAGVWILIVSVLLAVRARQAQAPPPAPPPPAPQVG